MKKKWMVFSFIALLMAALLVMAGISCSTGADDKDKDKNTDTNDNTDNKVASDGTGAYTGKDSNDVEYKLVISKDASGKLIYELFIKGESVSTGAATKQGETWVLQPNATDEKGDPAPKFTVTYETVKEKGVITDISGVIYPDDGTAPITPGTFKQLSVAGHWKWATSDDSKTNEWKNTDDDPNTKQSIFTPGGASRITNAVLVDDGEGVNYKPYEYPEGEAKDDYGNAIEETVYNFTGNTKVTSNNRGKDVGARFPLVGWEAVPNDDETLEQLKTAKGYSFYVRLNSATDKNWAFLTAVVTDFTPEEGHEYKHYFGNQPGDSGGNAKIENFTGGLELGKWHKITVVMDQSADGGGNIYQDKWIWAYDSGKNFRGDFHQDKAQKIQWQIPLQWQVGKTANVSARGGDPYDIVTGSYDFNLDFYGLKLIQE